MTLSWSVKGWCLKVNLFKIYGILAQKISAEKEILGDVIYTTPGSYS
jgi:hypothetical protein